MLKSKGRKLSNFIPNQHKACAREKENEKHMLKKSKTL
ncbi:hypothetical protein bcere0022_7440 [Bacillus cereus Rock3-44]|nr:hypothetical protein bcere0022_7440 [Bacillus cereus Rock3-44]